MLSEPDEFQALLRSRGGALYRRVLRVTGDEAEATRAAQALFVRLLVHGRIDPSNERARWAWIYRAGTNRGLQLLAATARPGGQGAPAVHALPTMAALREFDEATQNIVVLTALDGLPVVEVADVLGLSATVVDRKLEEWRKKSGAVAAAGPGDHPSVFALDRARATHDAHVAGCPSCQAALETAAQAEARFAATLDQEVVQRLSAQVAAERKAKGATGGVRWKRILILTASLAGVTIMAFAVARPKAPKPGDLPFRGNATASRAAAAGLQITVRRGTDIGSFVPGATSRLGDRLHFRVRAEGPRYFGLRVRGPLSITRLFPAEGDKAVLVKPGQALDRDYIVEGPLAAPGRTLYLEGFFSEREFVLDTKPTADIQLVPVRIDVE